MTDNPQTTHKTFSFRIPLGLYEQLEREAIDRKISVAQVVIERLEQTMEFRGFQPPETGPR